MTFDGFGRALGRLALGAVMLGAALVGSTLPGEAALIQISGFGTFFMQSDVIAPTTDVSAPASTFAYSFTIAEDPTNNGIFSVSNASYSLDSLLPSGPHLTASIASVTFFDDDSFDLAFENQAPTLTFFTRTVGHKSLDIGSNGLITTGPFIADVAFFNGTTIGAASGSAQSVVSPVPLPGTLPLFAGATLILGVFGYRSRRQAARALPAA